MVIFHCYVSSPEANENWLLKDWLMKNDNFGKKWRILSLFKWLIHVDSANDQISHIHDMLAHDMLMIIYNLTPKL